ncbi:DNA ligase [Candidatus Woesearchaeota archaeon]|nr:DNA ligase [Candidatus Woesearchaeota archaeon]
MSLKEYKKKRKFDKTPEPEAKKKKSSSKSFIFVIQKHDATNLHYDFRMEIDGVLKSWAVPKGPSVNPKEKRLAIETEDHPIDYADFEGIIPEGHYGAGTVMVWDKGTYKNTTEKDDKEIPAKKAYEKGHITFDLKGKKLKGGFALTRFREDKWLLVKEDDDYADARKKPVKSEPKSAKTGRTLKEIEKEEEKEDKDKKKKGKSKKKGKDKKDKKKEKKKKK